MLLHDSEKMSQQKCWKCSLHLKKFEWFEVLVAQLCWPCCCTGTTWSVHIRLCHKITLFPNHFLTPIGLLFGSERFQIWKNFLYIPWELRSFSFKLTNGSASFRQSAYFMTRYSAHTLHKKLVYWLWFK